MPGSDPNEAAQAIEAAPTEVNQPPAGEPAQPQAEQPVTTPPAGTDTH